MLITGNQLRAARALAGVDQQTVAEAAKVAVNTVRNMEGRGPNPITSGAMTVRSVQKALEIFGVVFTNDGEPGVKLRKHHYSISHLADVVKRFQQHLLQNLDWKDLKFEPLSNGFELCSRERPLGRITVVDERAVFEPVLPTPRTRADGWVTEDELRVWAEGLRGTGGPQEIARGRAT
jgi:hypothetical protein